MSEIPMKQFEALQARVNKNVTLLTLLVFYGSYPVQYLVNITIARALGPANYGDFSVSRSVATLAATVSLLGLDMAALHFLPVYLKRGALGSAKGFIYAALLAVIVTGLVVSGLGAVITEIVRTLMPGEEHPAMIAMYWVLPMSLGLLTLSFVGGHQHIFLSSLLGWVVAPLITAILLGVFFLFGGTLTDFRAVWLVILAQVLLTLVAVWLLWLIWRQKYLQVAPQYELKLWAAAILPYLLFAIVLNAQAQSSMIILEAFNPSEAEVGIYAAVQQVANLPVLALSAITMVAMPRLSVLLEGKEAEAFQQQLRVYLWILTAFGVGSLLVFMIWGHFLLDLFGGDFQSGHTALVILGAGYLIALVGGLVVPLLQIREENSSVNWTMLALMVLNVALTFLLAPRYGAIGAATAYTLTVVVITTIQLILLQRKTGIPYLRSMVGPIKKARL